MEIKTDGLVNYRRTDIPDIARFPRPDVPDISMSRPRQIEKLDSGLPLAVMPRLH